MEVGPTVNVTACLRAWTAGDRGALQQLLPTLYEELRRIATAYMHREHVGHTLQASALVNEAYLRLVDLKSVHWRDRAHFFALSARMMRRILVDHARAHGYLKRGSGAPRVEFDEGMVVSSDRHPELLELEDALTALASEDARKAQVVELRFFGGLTVEETAAVLSVSPQTVHRDWAIAKAWLMRHMDRVGHE